MAGTLECLDNEPDALAEGMSPAVEDLSASPLTAVAWSALQSPDSTKRVGHCTCHIKRVTFPSVRADPD